MARIHALRVPVSRSRERLPLGWALLIAAAVSVLGWTLILKAAMALFR